jgi:hypothetical protein
MTAITSSPTQPPIRSGESAVVALPRLGIAEYVIAGIVGLSAFALYYRTLAPGLLGGDSGEFQFAAWLGGFAHPTGYPLYLLLGYTWTHLLAANDPAWRMNLFSAVWGGMAVALVYLLTLQVVRIAAMPPGLPTWLIRLTSLVAALLFAVTPTFWSQAVITEVYTMHAALIAAILLGLVTWQAQGAASSNYRILYVTAFLFGLGLAHHRTTLLLLPAIVVFLWQGRRWSGSRREKLAGLARALLLVALPLLLYALIPLRAPQMPYADVVVSPEQVIQLYRPTFRWFAQHVSGSGFGSALLGATRPMEQLQRSLGWLVQEMSWPGILLGIAGIVWLFVRSRSLFLLTGLAFALLFGFNLFYGIGDIRVFYITTYLIWSVWAGVGLSAVAWLLLYAGSNVPLRRGISTLVCCAALALPIALLLQNDEKADQSRNDQLARFWQDVLAQPIPQGAILVSNDRDEMAPLWYRQYVENQRPDLTGLFPLIDTGIEWENVGQVIDAARRSGRRVFLIKPMTGLDIKFLTESVGPLVEVIGPAVTRAPDKASDISFGDNVRLIGYDLKPTLVAPGRPITISLYWQPQRRVERDLTSFVHLVNADGEVVGQSDHNPGGDFYPTSQWQPGELLKDAHSITLREELGRPPYALEVGLYDLEPELVHLGQPQVIGHIGREMSSDPVPAELASGQGYTLSDEIALLGHRVSEGADAVDVELFWQALRVPERDYTVFLHVVNDSGEIVAQWDSQPKSGEIPTGSWPAGLVVADVAAIELPEGLAEGSYHILAGLYDAASGERLPVYDASGRPAGDSIPLGEIHRTFGS